MAHRAWTHIHPYVLEKPGIYLYYSYGDSAPENLWVASVLTDPRRYVNNASFKYFALISDDRDEITTFRILEERPGLAVPNAEGRRLWGGGFKTDDVVIAPSGAPADKDEAFGLRFLQLMRPYFTVDDIARIAVLSRNEFVLNHLHIYTS